MRRFLMLMALISLVLGGGAAGEASEELLTPQEIRPIMREFFRYHIDRKEISPLLIKRSFKIYLEIFDPLKLYLLKEEVEPYINPDPIFISKALADYRQGNFEYYFALQDMIQEAIQRAQRIREDLTSHPEVLFYEADNFDENTFVDRSGFAEGESEIYRRWKNRLLAFIKLEEDVLDRPLSEADQLKILEFFNKRQRGHEDSYMVEGAHEESWVTTMILKSLARSLDAHSAYFTPEEAREMRTRLEKDLQGIGVVLREDLEGIVVVKVIKGGTAQESGKIQAGDIIVKIDGKDIRQVPLSEVLEMLRGKLGTEVDLTVVKTTSGKELTVHLSRRDIVLTDERVDSENYTCEGGNIGVLTLHSFYENPEGVGAEDDIISALKDLKEKGNLKGLVLDLRQNRGGFLMQAVKVAGLFITNGVVVASRYSNGEIKYFRDVDGRSYYDGPLVILISKASASAAEIVADALQDYGRAIIVGDERSYGKGTIQHQNITSGRDEDAFFKVTVGRYYTVSGESAQIGGVEADIIIPTEYYNRNIGERYLDYPLPSDSIPPSYSDTLSDVSPVARKWFKKYYTPTLENKNDYWEGILPTLRRNSQERLDENDNYKQFLKNWADGQNLPSEASYGAEDLIKLEAINIVKDMVFLRSQKQNHADITSGSSHVEEED
ncbi:MAG: S41 family peptidase [Chlamydiota bacterium]